MLYVSCENFCEYVRQYFCRLLYKGVLIRYLINRKMTFSHDNWKSKSPNSNRRVRVRLHQNLRCPCGKKVLGCVQPLNLSWVIWNNVMNYLLYEQCILQFSQNLMKFFCQACTSIKWFYVNLHNFWRSFWYYYHYCITRWLVEVRVFPVS
jgi:hypothetical protein